MYRRNFSYYSHFISCIYTPLGLNLIIDLKACCWCCRCTWQHRCQCCNTDSGWTSFHWCPSASCGHCKCTTACSQRNRTTTCSAGGPDCHKRRKQALPHPNRQPDASRIAHVEQTGYEMHNKTRRLKVSKILKSLKIRYNDP